MNQPNFLQAIKKQLIVSCQAVDNEPLNDVHAITLMAKAVLAGGAKVLRLSQVDHIKSITEHFPNVPVIGLIKRKYENSEVIITCTEKEVQALLDLKVECIALDATTRPRPQADLKTLVAYIRQHNHQVVIMGDCATLEDVRYAQACGVDIISTTLRGYTQASQGLSNITNHYEFIQTCLKNTTLPVIAEGGIWEPYQVKDLLALGCHAVVVGSAITRPLEITKRFLKELEE